MDFRKSVLNLFSNKVSEEDKKNILKEMENKADDDIVIRGYLAYYYHEIDHDHNKHLKYEENLDEKELIEKAKQDADTAYITALLTSAGIVFDESVSDMKKWFEFSAEKGNPLADFEMGFYHYHLGLEGEEKNSMKEFKRALEYFDKAAKKDLVEAVLAMAEIYVEIDDRQNAEKMFKKALKYGDSDGYLGLALLEYDSNNYKKAKEYLLKSYETDKNRIAAFYLAGMYMEEGDNEKGLFYLRDSAEQGNIDAMFDLGVIHFEGELLPQDDEKAFEYFMKAAQKGDAGSQFYIGVFYKEGRVVEQSDSDAKYWLEAAADQGDEDAIELLNNF